MSLCEERLCVCADSQPAPQVHVLADAAAVHLAENSVRACEPSLSTEALHAERCVCRKCVRPRRYRHTSYQKQTKNQWARDDPAFVVICCLLLAVAAAAYCATCGALPWQRLCLSSVDRGP